MQVALAFYSVPSTYVGKTLRARADRALVRIFFGPGPEPLKVHARQPPGGRSIDRNDYPKEKTAYALRDVTFLQRQASEQGEHVGRFAKLLLDGPLPWTRMRQVYGTRPTNCVPRRPDGALQRRAWREAREQSGRSE